MSLLHTERENNIYCLMMPSLFTAISKMYHYSISILNRHWLMHLIQDVYHYEIMSSRQQFYTFRRGRAHTHITFILRWEWQGLSSVTIPFKWAGHALFKVFKGS